MTLAKFPDDRMYHMDSAEDLDAFQARLERRQGTRFTATFDPTLPARCCRFLPDGRVAAGRDCYDDMVEFARVEARDN